MTRITNITTSHTKKTKYPTLLIPSNSYHPENKRYCGHCLSVYLNLWEGILYGILYRFKLRFVYPLQLFQLRLHILDLRRCGHNVLFERDAKLRLRSGTRRSRETCNGSLKMCHCYRERETKTTTPLVIIDRHQREVSLQPRAKGGLAIHKLMVIGWE